MPPAEVEPADADVEEKENDKEMEEAVVDQGFEGPCLVRPGRFSRFLVRWPLLVMFISGSTALVLGILAFAGGSSDLGGSFTDTSHPIVKKLFGFLAAESIYREDSGFDGSYRRRLGAEEDKRDGLFGRFPYKEMASQGRGRRLEESSLAQRDDEWTLNVLLKSKSKNAVSSQGLRHLRRVIREVLDAKGYGDFCLSEDGGSTCVSPITLARALFVDGTSVSSDCAAADDCDGFVSEATPVCEADRASLFTLPDVNAAGALESLKALCDSTATVGERNSYTYDTVPLAAGGEACIEPVASLRQAAVGGSWDCESNAAKFLRAKVKFGVPGHNKVDYDDDTERTKIGDWANAELMPLLQEARSQLEKSTNGQWVLAFDGSPDPIQYYINQDLMFLVLAIVLVGILLYNQTESAFLTLCGLFEIIISFPIGLFFWNVVLQQKYITYLMYNGAFIILGIGADDIFVLVDAWKQSALHPDPRVRNDILLRFAWTYDRAAFAMFATSLTTSAAFFSCAASVIWDIKCFGVVNGVMVVADFLLVITWLPAAIIVRERYFPDWLKAASFTQCAKSLVRLVLCRKPVLAEPAPLAVQAVSAPPSSGGPMSTAPDYAQSERLLERFFYTSYGGFVYKRKRSILVVWSAIFAASLAVWTTLLLPDDKATPFFADDHVFEQWLRWSDEEFLLDRADDKTPSFLVFGVKQGDPWRDDQDSHPACIGDDPDCAGKPNYSGLHFAKNQLAIAAACKAYGESLSSSGQMPQYETETNAYCFMSLFHKWALSKGLAVPYAATDEIEFASKLLEWRDSDDEPFGLRFLNAASAFYGENTGFVVSDGVVKAGWAGYNTSLNWDRATFVEMWEFHDDAQSAWGAAKRQGVDREDSYQTTENYSWMVASGVFYDAARSNLLISVCLAATVMFYVTLNWAVTLVATVSLIAVIAGVLATMAIAGWKVNIIESIDISIAGGMAVDYILHLAHAFNHQESFLTGEGRVRGALGEMGVSVLSGALTTLSATCALFCCQLLWFRNFGIFIALLVVWSIVVSMLPMMALFCYIPGGDFGRVDFSGLRPKLCNKHCASAAPDEAAVAK